MCCERNRANVTDAGRDRVLFDHFAVECEIERVEKHLDRLRRGASRFDIHPYDGPLSVKDITP